MQIVNLTPLLKGEQTDENGSNSQKDAGVTEVRKYKVSESNSHIPAVTLHFSSQPLNLALRK